MLNSRTQNLTGKTFERLTVLSFKGTNKNKKILWLCSCSCGNIKTIPANSLKTGNTKSCGCLKHELDLKRNKTHGETKSKFYRIWQSMKNRCGNKKHQYFYCYGGRGIKYDLRWNDFLSFKRDMLIKYKTAKLQYGKGVSLSLERKDVNGDYCFGNCCFIPKTEQAKNTRRNIFFIAISPTGERYKEHNQSEFARKHNLCRISIGKCIRGKLKQYHGWVFKKIKRS